MKYVTRVRSVEAVRFLGIFVGQKREFDAIPDSYFDEYPEWLAEGFNTEWNIIGQLGARKEDARSWVEIPEGDSAMRAEPGDYIVRLANGTLDVFKPGVFLGIYEPATPDRKTE